MRVTKPMQEIDVDALDGRLLQLLCDVYDLGSVSKAAAKRGINQSTASYSLDRLRSILGDPLFLRSGRNITPTEYTHSIIPRVRLIVGEMEGLFSSSLYDPRGDASDMRIYMNANELLPEMSRIYHALKNQGFAGHVRFIELGSRENIEPLLQSGQADLVISVRTATKSPIARSLTLSSDAVVCFYDAKTRGPVETIDDYCAAEHIVLDFGGDNVSTVAASVKAAHLERKIAMSVPSVAAMAEMIRGSAFLASMQSSLSHSVFAGLSHCDMPLACPETCFELFWHRRNENSPRSRWFRSIIGGADIFV